ncbi:MAG: phosphonoacetate hydrolase [Verrucomicrobia subdivision 3 bacterium]|nr:phosphonoacetate hydrolase [Limisphaerales bacterium]
MPPQTNTFTVNGRTYTPPPRPVVVCCLDGSADEYLDAALARGRMPNLQKMAVEGYRGLARGAMPSFTNVNNSSIVTGVPPCIHGIGGNYFYDTASGQEVMTNSAKFLRADTIFPAAARAGRRVAVITAKDKLRDIFAHGLIEKGGIAFSSEKANQARRDTHGLDNVEKLVGLPTPPIYSADASTYLFHAGVKLLEHNLTDFLYLSTTDFIQHKFLPEQPEALELYSAIDEQLGWLLKRGAVVGITADHGMNSKQKPDGSPNVIHLETELTKKYGPGFRVILPITDPYVVHHGALGSFAVVHLPSGTSARRKLHVLQFLNKLPGVTEVYGRNAAEKLELPADRLGDIVVISGRDVVLGRTPEYHDLKAIEGGLRSHGGRYEEMVPFVFSHPLKREYKARALADPRNFDVFDFTVNGLQL